VSISYPLDRASSESGFSVHDQAETSRSDVEALISRVYADRYQAVVLDFTPTLVSLRREAGVVAAAGYRRASQEALFLERYLGAPVESLLGPYAGMTPRREQIFEVGHLAAARAGAGRDLVVSLCRHLVDQGCEWVVATVTQELDHLFVRAGVEPVRLGAARPGALGSDAAAWGTYYQHLPMVQAAHLPRALRRLTRSRAGTHRSTRTSTK
jgi:Thermostable hemolysin